MNDPRIASNADASHHATMMSSPSPLFVGLAFYQSKSRSSIGEKKQVDQRVQLQVNRDRNKSKNSNNRKNGSKTKLSIVNPI